jgi:hypothetical protein
VPDVSFGVSGLSIRCKVGEHHQVDGVAGVQVEMGPREISTSRMYTPVLSFLHHPVPSTKTLARSTKGSDTHLCAVEFGADVGCLVAGSVLTAMLAMSRCKNKTYQGIEVPRTIPPHVFLQRKASHQVRIVLGALNLEAFIGPPVCETRGGMADGAVDGKGLERHLDCGITCGCLYAGVVGKGDDEMTYRMAGVLVAVQP